MAVLIAEFGDGTGAIPTVLENLITADLRITDALMGIVSNAREKSNRHGERFNIFTILRVHRSETETHSRFLHELLSPRGRHGEDNVFLLLFLGGVLGLQTSGEGSYRVALEQATAEKRRVDIAIESPNAIVGIELKIDAADQPAQLHDYYQELQRRAAGKKQVVLVYLTLAGRLHRKQPARVCHRTHPAPGAWGRAC